MASVVASLRTSFVMCLWCSLKSSTILMCTPSILYYFLGGRYFIIVPSGNVMVWICSCRVFWFLLLSGLPRAHRAPVASHLLVSSCRPVYVLKRCTFLSCILRSVMVPFVMLMSSS